MARKPTRKPAKAANKGGRPRVEINISDLEKLAGMRCTYEEAAAFFDCSLATIERRLGEPKYRDAWEHGLGKGLVSLRRYQFALAKTNAHMAIWLGKQYLGQRDISQHELSGPGGAPIEHAFNFDKSSVGKLSAEQLAHLYRATANAA